MVLVSVVGTQITDLLTNKLEISLYLSTAVFAATFAIWYGVEQTLSIHTIVTKRRELLYWAAILFTFALGTTAGDLATAGLNRTSIYRAFGGRQSPNLSTVIRCLDALGLQFNVVRRPGRQLTKSVLAAKRR